MARIERGPRPLPGNTIAEGPIGHAGGISDGAGHKLVRAIGEGTEPAGLAASDPDVDTPAETNPAAYVTEIVRKGVEG